MVLQIPELVGLSGLSPFLSGSPGTTFFLFASLGKCYIFTLILSHDEPRSDKSALIDYSPASRSESNTYHTFRDIVLVGPAFEVFARRPWKEEGSFMSKSGKRK